VNDDELLSRWRAGDAAAAESLFERHFDSLYRFFRNKAPASADDLVQRTLLACFEARDRFRGECSFRTYLFAAARNQLLNHLGRERAGGRIEPERDSVADSAPSPSSLMQTKHEQEVVLHALRRIPVDHQILLELFYWEQQSGAELAEILGVPEGTIRSRLRRARDLLTQQVQAIAGQPHLVDSTLSRLDDWAAALRDAQAPDRK
jgi:RNA polymerase sigma-70 factor (ECF subfamily)